MPFWSFSLTFVASVVLRIYKLISSCCQAQPEHFLMNKNNNYISNCPIKRFILGSRFRFYETLMQRSPNSRNLTPTLAERNRICFTILECLKTIDHSVTIGVKFNLDYRSDSRIRRFSPTICRMEFRWNIYDEICHTLQYVQLFSNFFVSRRYFYWEFIIYLYFDIWKNTQYWRGFRIRSVVACGFWSKIFLCTVAYTKHFTSSLFDWVKNFVIELR